MNSREVRTAHQIHRRRLSCSLLALLAACGGGGGGEPAPPASAPPPPPPPTPPPPAPAPSVLTLSGPSPVAADCRGGTTGGTLFVDAESEPLIAIDPRNAQRMLVAWQQDRWSTTGARALLTAASVDGGRRWQTTMHPMSRCGGAAPGGRGDFERVTDPWVDFSPDGSAYLMGMVLEGTSFAPNARSAMLVSRSADGGLTWDEPVALIDDRDGFFNDKNTLTADPTDARRLYAVWHRLDRSLRGPTMFARSVDGGTSWQPARAIVVPEPENAGGAAVERSSTAGNRIVVLAGGAARGTLVNVFTQTDIVGGVTRRRIGSVRSGDGGDTWSAPVFIGELGTVGTTDAATGLRIRDGNTLPAAAGGPDGSVWVAWQDARFSSGAFDAIVIARSLDGGQTWGAPARVNRRPDVPAFTPVVHVRADGLVGVLHFDLRRNTTDPSTLWTDAWLLTSADGTAWRETHVAGPFDLVDAPTVGGGLFIGDYHGLASDGRDFVAALAIANRDVANRTDIVVVRRDPGE